MARINKDVVVRIMPFILSGAALIWCMKQCSSIDNAADKADQVQAYAERVDSACVATENSLSERIDANEGTIERVVGQVSGLNARVNAAMDSIDSINARVDSLRKARTCCAQTAVVSAKKKAVAKKTVRKTERIPQQGRFAAGKAKVADSVAVVNVNNAGTGNTNVVNVNNGGTINNYYGTTAPNAAEAKAQQGCNNEVVLTYRRIRTVQVTVEHVR